MKQMQVDGKNSHNARASDHNLKEARGTVKRCCYLQHKSKQGWYKQEPIAVNTASRCDTKVMITSLSHILHVYKQLNYWMV